MAALMHRGRRNPKRASRPTNVYVEDQGRRYRVCFSSPLCNRVLMVMLKCPAGGERYVDPWGRRGRVLVKLAQNPPEVQ